MGRTRDYRTPSQILFDKYREKGMAEGRAEGLAEGKEIGEFELALAAINDGTGTLEYFKSIRKWSEDKTKRFQMFMKNSQEESSAN